jgi:hypothetical protein
MAMNDYVDSAKRLYADAVLLDTEERIATASHLYGFVGECVLKALMSGLLPVAKPPSTQHLSNELWEVFSAHPALADSPERISKCERFKNGYSSWNVHQRYSSKENFSRSPKLDNESASARGLMNVLDQVQRGLL